MTVDLIQGLRACVLGAIVAITGCASASTSDEPQSYETALHECRMLQPGRLNKRLNLPANSLRVSACLRERGWAPDGSRTATLR